MKSRFQQIARFTGSARTVTRFHLSPLGLQQPGKTAIIQKTIQIKALSQTAVI